LIGDWNHATLAADNDDSQRMKPIASRDSKAALKTKTDALVADLQAIRAQVASKRTPNATFEELEGLQRRLFEVWVAEQLALVASRQEQSSAEIQAISQELAEALEELSESRKEVARLGKALEKLGSTTEKLSLKVAAKKQQESRKKK
jgi:Zn-dependent oligopeptidase